MSLSEIIPLSVWFDNRIEIKVTIFHNKACIRENMPHSRGKLKD